MINVAIIKSCMSTITSNMINTNESKIAAARAIRVAAEKKAKEAEVVLTKIDATLKKALTNTLALVENDDSGMAWENAWTLAADKTGFNDLAKAEFITADANYNAAMKAVWDAESAERAAYNTVMH